MVQNEMKSRKYYLDNKKATSVSVLYLESGSERLFVCLFACLLVAIKPEKLYSASCVEMEINPLGAWVMITHGQRHKPRAYPRQRHNPRTCQSMVNTQFDGLACIPGHDKGHI